MLEVPCKDCPDKHAECHSECDKYIAFDILNDIIREQRYMESRREDNLFKTSRHNPTKKKRRRGYADNRGGC